MVRAASNQSEQILAILVDNKLITIEHKTEILKTHFEMRAALFQQYPAIWQAPSHERHAILTGQIALQKAKELGYELTEQLLTNMILKQQIERVEAALRDILAAKLGVKLNFEHWVANLYQNMFDTPDPSAKMVALGDLARELAVITAHNPVIADPVAKYLDLVSKILFRHALNIAGEEISTCTNSILNFLASHMENGDITDISIYDELGLKVMKSKEDFTRFLDDTRKMLV